MFTKSLLTPQNSKSANRSSTFSSKFQKVVECLMSRASHAAFSFATVQHFHRRQVHACTRTRGPCAGILGQVPANRHKNGSCVGEHALARPEWYLLKKKTEHQINLGILCNTRVTLDQVTKNRDHRKANTELQLRPSVLDRTKLTRSEAEQSLVLLTCTILPGSHLKATSLTVLVSLHRLRLHGNAPRSCKQIFLPRENRSYF